MIGRTTSASLVSLRGRRAQHEYEPVHTPDHVLVAETDIPKKRNLARRRRWAGKARRTWLEAPRLPKCGPRARLDTNVPCRPRTRARGTPIGRPAARQHARSARSYPLLMRHRRASPTAPVRDSCDEWPDHARPAAPRAPLHRSLTASPAFCPRRCWLLHDGQPGCRTELRPVSTAGGQLHGTGRDALTAAAHARLLAAKQHLDSRSSVRCSPPGPCEPHASRAFLTAPDPTPTGATRCPDAHRRESSGCGGGVAPCREGRGLSGVYCTQCPERQARHPAVALQPRRCTAPLPRQPCPTALRGSPPLLPATSQYVDPLRGACASCDDVQWSAALPALLAALALALAARRLVASSPAVARAAKRAVRRFPRWMLPGLPHWTGTFQSVVYVKIVW